MQINYHQMVVQHNQNSSVVNVKLQAIRTDDIAQSKTVNTQYATKSQSNSTVVDCIQRRNLSQNMACSLKKYGRFSCKQKQNMPLLGFNRQTDYKLAGQSRETSNFTNSNGNSFGALNDSINKQIHLDQILGINDVDSKINFKKSERSGKGFDNLFKVSQTKRFNVFNSLPQKDHDNQNPFKIGEEKKEINSKILNQKQLKTNKVKNRFIKNKNHLQTNMNINGQSKLTNASSLVKILLKSQKSSNTSNCQSQNMLMELKKTESDQIEPINLIQNQKDGYFEPKSYVQIQSLVKLKKINEVQNEKKRLKNSNKDLDMQKYLKNNLTRYSINQLQSLHRAILQYSKGEMGLLKKSLVVVLNMSGILIEEQKLDQMGVSLDNKKKKGKSNTKKKLTNYTNPPKKSKQTLRSFRNIISGKTIGDFNKTSKQRVEKVLQQNLRNISNFDCFLQLYKTIEIYYFKQSIIDYLQILLGGIEFEYKKKPKARRKMETQITIMFKQGEQYDSQSSEQVAREIQIGYDQLYEAFRKRNQQEDTLKVVNFIQLKIKQHYKQNLRSVYHQSQRRGSKLQSKKKHSEPRIGQDWRITLKQLFNLCYYDNQLCQLIHEFYVKETNRAKLS